MDRGSTALVSSLVLVSLAGCPEGSTDDSPVLGPLGGVVEACGRPTPCAELGWQCDALQDAEGCVGVAYSDALVCMLETMAAGEPAQLKVNFGGYVTGEVEWVDVAVYGADAAVYQHGTEDPTTYDVYWDSVEQCTPRPPEFFEACLADAGDAQQHAACMNPYEWFEGCSEATACL